MARLVQGAFGALLIPQGFGILGSVFPREHIGKAFSAFGPILGLSAVGGPLLAGLLIDANLFGLGWRPMFLINIVLGAAGLAAGLRLLPRDAGDRAVRIDALGSALLAACMLGLLFGLIQGSLGGRRVLCGVHRLRAAGSARPGRALPCFLLAVGQFGAGTDPAPTQTA